MDENKGLNILSVTLEFSDEEARKEFKWLKMMAAIKYDDYRDFLPGMRFLENLAAWLQQFDSAAERREAYQLLRERLIYISPPEMQRLVELLYPCVIERRLIEVIAARRGIPKYMVRVDKQARDDFFSLRRRTLILGLSDGARIDILRHSTVGLLSNEQFVVQAQTDRFKWTSLLKDLHKVQADAAFELIVLVDDFTGTGSSFLRYDKDNKKWTGKLCKFLTSLRDAMKTIPDIVTDDWQLCVHHYLGTERAAQDIAAREQEALGNKSPEVPLKHPSHYTFGAKIAQEVCISATNVDHAPLVALTQSYYNPKIETEHTKVGGVKHLGLGYGACGLPLILHHNTPNNSLALLWAEEPTGKDETGESYREMRPLFRRRQRHTV